MSFFFHDTATTEIYTLSLHDALPISEPKSMIGFAGPRVIKETTHQDLPKGFQTAEFLQEHGLIDIIVHLKKLDRKSTRLNSSHANISYAVFCLKKKKK